LWLRQQRYCRDYGKTGREESRHAASIDPNGLSLGFRRAHDLFGFLK
jgi:hypothetical protein